MSAFFLVNGNLHNLEFVLKNVEQLTSVKKVKSFELRNVEDNSEDVKKLCRITFFDDTLIIQTLPFEIFNSILGGIEDEKIINKSSFKLPENKKITYQDQIAAESCLQVIEEIEKKLLFYKIFPGAYNGRDF